MTMYGLSQEDDNTDPVTGQPIPAAGAVGALPTTSAPPVSGGTADVSGAPLSRNQATDTQAGGAEPLPAGPQQPPGPDLTKDQGKPDVMVKKKFQDDPDGTMEVVDASFEALKKMREAADPVKIAQMEQLSQQIEAQGGGGEKAKEQMIEQAETGIDRAVEDGKITKKQGKQKKFALNNIFKTIKREEMSLFLIDFGFRAMMAGEGMGDAAALGAAGSGALGALQGRRDKNAENQIEDLKYAKETEFEDRRVGALETQAEASMIRAKSEENEKPNIQWTKDGAVVIERQDDGSWKSVPLENAEGMQLQPGLTPGGKQGQFRDQWMYDQMIASGYSEREAVDFINGAPTESEVRLTVQRVWLAYDDRQKLRSPISGEVKNKSEFTDAEYKRWLDEQIGAWSSGKGALPPSTNPGKDAVDDYADDE
jgi:hypothetical protein